jgi:histidinol-phosphate aminotransferase
MIRLRTPVSPLASSLNPYVPGEQPKPGEVFCKLNTNENPYPPSPAVHVAIENAIGGLPLYPDPTSSALCAAIASRHGLSVDQVFVGNGSDEVLAHCFPAFFCEQDAPVLFADITYSFYEVYAAFYRVPAIQIPLSEDFCVDVDTFVHTENAGILLANPNAPTGIALTPDEILRIVNAHPQSAVIVDEAYVEFGAQSLIPFIPRCPNLVIVRTLSKSHALAGLRVGYAVGNSLLIKALWAVKDSFNSYPLDRLAQAGATAALLDDEYTLMHCERIMRTRARFVETLRHRRFRVLESKANFVFASPPGGEAAALQTALRKRGILVRHFAKPRIAQWLRISVGTDESMNKLIEAIDKIGIESGGTK